MSQDFDMKIYGAQSGAQKEDTTLFSDESEYKKEKSNGNLTRAANLGYRVAEEFVKVCRRDELTLNEGDNEQIALQRILLLSFTVMAGFEKFCPNMTLANSARSAFFDKLALIDKELFEKSSDTGAFSFYYLSFRRGNDVERRIGQTFAMLCLHDGDPIYQELGEALYCWFFSTLDNMVKNAGFVEMLEKN